MTSSYEESICQHAASDMDNGKNGNEYNSGDPIPFKYNGEIVSWLSRGFTWFEYCLDMDEVDVANDKFQLQSDGTDGTCISSLSIDYNQLLVGKHRNLTSFWIDGNDQYCLDDFMSTSEITIQDGQVYSSLCNPNGKQKMSLKRKISVNLQSSRAKFMKFK